MKRSLLSLACMALPCWASADTIQGVVLDEQGAPLAGANVQVVGSRTSVSTDAAGRFRLEALSSDDVELHIRAPDYMHKNVHVHDGATALEVTLRETAIEVVDVTGLPWHVSRLESATPVSVIGGEALRRQQSATLGDTLARQVGVHSSHYGPVAGSPIIRGLSGPRVLVAQNGLDVGDVSRSGPDHAVTAEAATARQVEILRGPATLFYGSGAIGGVINVVDNRIPRDLETFGQFQLGYDGANHQKLVQGSVNTSAGDLAFHADGFWRDAGDLDVPGYAAVHPDADAAYGVLENSAYDAEGATLGTSYLMDAGFVGVSAGRMERGYGIPGHSHGGLAVQAQMEQDRVQLVGEYSFDHPLLSELRARYGYTDYRHYEIEGNTIGTTFENELHEARFELFHQPVNEWRGAVSVHVKREDTRARGEEAFTPPASTDMLALSLMEEKHFGDWLVQLGARIERVQIDATDVRPNDEVYQTEHAFTPYSFSAGTVWDFTHGYNIGLSLSHSQRAPSATELLSLGPHIGAGTYEVGALFDIVSDDHGDWVVNVAGDPLELETANNIDLSLRKFSGDLGFVVGVFYNRVDDFYYSRATGLAAETGHAHEHEQASGGAHEEHQEHEEHSGHEEADHEAHSDPLPVYQFTATGVDLYGFESEVNWPISQPLMVKLTADYTRAERRSGGNLPRIPPLRAGLTLDYELGRWQILASATRYFEADNTDALETTTDAYTWVDAEVSYTLPVGDQTRLYLRGENLLDETARVHSSFIKDMAPRQGRALSAGIRASF